MNTLENIILEAWEEFPNYFITSSTNYTGKEALLNYIEMVNEELITSTNKLPLQ